MILLTGASGYIGARLHSRLLADDLKDLDLDVILLDRESGEPDEGAKFIKADLCNSAEYASHLDGVDTVFHLAAAKGDWGISEAEYQRDNVDATRELIKAGTAAGVKRWLFYSTVSTVGPSSVPLDEGAETNPVNDYGKSKLDSENLFRELVDTDRDCEVLFIRPSVVFGPDNPWNTNIYRLIDAIYRRRFVMVGQGESVKSTSYIDNLIEATVFLMQRFKPGIQVFNYTDEPVISTDELVGKLYSMLDMKRPGLRLPLGVTKTIASVSDRVADLTGRDLPITSARIEKFCTSTNFSSRRIRELGFEQPVSNEYALQSTVDWYLDSVAT